MSAIDALARVFIIWTYGRYLSNSSLSRCRDGVPAHESEEPQVPQGIERDDLVPLQMERREIPMIILQSLTHELRAVFRREREGRAAFGGFLGFRLIEFEQRLVAFGAFAVGSSGRLELDEAQVDAHLDFFPAVVAGDEPDLKLVRLEFPTVE